jgi:hypothetical protein
MWSPHEMVVAPTTRRSRQHPLRYLMELTVHQGRQA